MPRWTIWASMLCAMVLGRAAAAVPITDEQARLACNLNPALAPSLLAKLVEEQRRENPALTSFSDAQIVEMARSQGLSDCATKLRRNPAAFDAIQSFRVDDSLFSVAWDAWNIRCAARGSSAAACIRAEVTAFGATRYDGSDPMKEFAVTACQLALQTMASFQEAQRCTETVVRAKPTTPAFRRCRLSGGHHSELSGVAAARRIIACAQQGTLGG